MSEPVRDPEKILLRLEWTVLRRLEGVLQGDYRSLFRGFGIDFAELRAYQYGDEVRHIDWNVTARLQTPHVRVYNEDREVTAWFLLDLSPSVSFGSGRVRKRTVAIEFVTVLARLLSRHGNPVGALFYGDRVDAQVPARGGRRHVLGILQRMLSRPERAQSGATKLADLLLAGRRVIPRRSIVFVVSDFISASGWEEALAHLARRHEIVAVRLYDSLEMELPDLGLLVVQDSESGEQAWVDTHDPGFRRRFTDAAARHEARIRSGLSGAGVDALELSTADDLVPAIVRFAELRRRRRNLSAGGSLPHHLGGAMSFMWPDMLWLLTLMPVLIAAYLLLLRRRKKTALRFANLSLVKEAMGKGPGVRRHIPPALFLLALIVLILAVSRPSAVLTLPNRYQTIILAMDISGSMRATDIAPSRIAAAQSAAKKFVSDQPRGTRIGVVTFAGSAAVAHSPTENREEILAAIDRFQLQRATAIGSGILVALKAIFPDAEFDLRSFNPRPDSLWSAPLDTARDTPKAPAAPVPPGSFRSAAIILLTDGQSNVGPDPIESARMAAERGVRVYTVGFGTVEGEILRFEGWSMRVRLDEETLKKVAELTHGEYYLAGSAADLEKVYATLSARLVFETRESEITALFSAAAAVLALAAGLLSVWWYNRIL